MIDKLMVACNQSIDICEECISNNEDTCDEENLDPNFFYCVKHYTELLKRLKNENTNKDIE